MGKNDLQKNNGALGLNTIEIDTIGEILNISMGAAATAISLMLSRQVVITTPTVKVIPPSEFEFTRLEPALGIEIEYSEGLHGSNIMIMSVRDARAIVGLLLQDSGGEESMSSAEMDELQLSALGEIMNQMMGASSTALATFLNRSINISPPKSFEMVPDTDHFNWLKEQDFIVTVGFRFVVEDLLDSEFITVMPVEFTRDLVKNAMSMDEDDGTAPHEAELMYDDDPDPLTGHRQIPTPIDDAAFAPEPPKSSPKRPAPPEPAPRPRPEPRPEPRYERDDPYPYPPYEPRYEPRYESRYEPEPPYERRAPRRSVDVKPLAFANLDNGGGEDADQVNLDLVMDIDLNVVVEIGRTKKLVKEIVALRQGSIIELDKLAGEPVDIMVNGKLIARGDVVVIDDNFGVRITEIVDSLTKP